MYGISARAVLLTLALLLLPNVAARAYLVGPAPGVKAMAASSDLIFKGTVTSSVRANDKLFQAIAGYANWKTQFTIVSVIKGKARDPVTFRHYDRVTRCCAVYDPQYYHFEVGRTYLVFAETSSVPGVYQQLWLRPVGKPDQGVVLCADSDPVTTTDARTAVWTELIAMLQSSRPSDVRYAIQQLDEMSGLAGWRPLGSVSDFDRNDILRAVHMFVSSSNPGVAQAAIDVVGSHNPYLSDDVEARLAAVGSAYTPGISIESPREDTSGKLYWRELAAVANSHMDGATRGRAILALGLVYEVQIEDQLAHWVTDQSPNVRAAAAELLADYRDVATRQRLTALANDPEPQVRAAAAVSIGFGQYVWAADILSRLLHDADATVRKNAGLSLLSFRPNDASIASILKANLSDREFAPLFLNALALENPRPYLEDLANELKIPTEPHLSSWSGEMPGSFAWSILFHYLADQSVDAIASGQFDHYLDLMNQWAMTSYDVGDMYAFYVQRGMTERAKSYRQKADSVAKYDIDRQFEQIDRSPLSFVRQWGDFTKDPDPIEFTLEVKTKYISPEQAPAFRVSVTNLSSQPLVHEIIPGSLGFALRLDGPAGIPLWWFERHASRPYIIHLAPGEQKYIFGSASSFVNSDAATFHQAEYYNVKYCDDWLAGPVSRTICSNSIQLRILQVPST